MMSAKECRAKADELERHAHSLSDLLDQNILLETAQHWHLLARAAEVALLQRGEIQDSDSISPDEITHRDGDARD